MSKSKYKITTFKDDGKIYQSLLVNSTNVIITKEVDPVNDIPPYFKKKSNSQIEEWYNNIIKYEKSIQ